MRITVTFLIFLIFIGCQNDKQSKNMRENMREKLVEGNWKNFVQNEISTEITILKNGNYIYQSNAELIFFSNGDWNIKNDTLYLNSIMPKECFFVSNFGPSCRNPNMIIEELIETTVENCKPLTWNKYFTKFSNEKFILRNDTLTHIPKCKNVENLKFHR